MINGAIARILLRYVIGAVLVGSSQVGEKLAADPDIVMLVAGGIGLAVEGFYFAARRYGWSL